MLELDANSKIILNRLFFLSPDKKIDDNCPFFVIEFVCKTLGIKFNYSNENWKIDPESLISTANSILEEDLSISPDDLDNSFPDIALFVNPETSIPWVGTKSLIDSFWSIINFTPKIPLKKEECFGNKTPDNINAIDPIMVYQIAYHYKIPFSRNTSLEDIQYEILNYSSKLTPLRQNLLFKFTSDILSRNRRGLIKLKSFISDSPNSLSSDIFPEKYPKTNKEAIERAAKDYRWDISLSSDPISEYKELDSVSDDKYNPIDASWRKIFNINRKYFHLDFRYMEKYDHLYNDNVKKGLIYRNGGKLENNYLILGLHPLNPQCINKDIVQTSIYKQNISVYNNPIDIYRNIISSPEFIVTREELYDMWNYKKAFVAPNNFSKVLSDHNLNMIRINSNPDDKLRILIEDIQKSRKERIDLITNINNKDIYMPLLEEILELGLIIRGYNTCYDNKEYPLEESAYDIEKYQDKIESESILKSLSIFEKYSNILSQIPVFTGRNIVGETSDNFKVSMYDLTLNLKNVIERIFTPGVLEGCIRTNSNYLLITAWVFINKFNESPPFDIEKLRLIS